MGLKFLSEERREASILTLFLNHINDVLDHFFLVAELRGDQVVLAVEFIGIAGRMKRVDFVGGVIEGPVLVYPDLQLSKVIDSNLPGVHMHWPRLGK